jgi:hypothetical protein
VRLVAELGYIDLRGPRFGQPAPESYVPANSAHLLLMTLEPLMMEAPNNDESADARSVGVRVPESDSHNQIDNTWRAREWRDKRYKKFAELQKTKQEWICLADLLDLAGNIAYRELLQWLRQGAFRKPGKSRVLYLHPWTYRVRMDLQFITHIVEVYRGTPFIIRDQYLCRCWIPRPMAEDWCRKRGFALDTKRSSRGRKKGGISYDDRRYIAETMRLILAGHSERTAIRLAVGEVGDKNKTMNRVRKKYREGLRR